MCSLQIKTCLNIVFSNGQTQILQKYSVQTTIILFNIETQFQVISIIIFRIINIKKVVRLMSIYIFAFLFISLEMPRLRSTLYCLCDCQKEIFVICVSKNLYIHGQALYTLKCTNISKYYNERIEERNVCNINTKLYNKYFLLWNNCD